MFCAPAIFLVLMFILIAFVVFVKSLVSRILSVNIIGISIGQGSSNLSGEFDE